MFLVNSRQSLVTATFFGSRRIAFHLLKAPLLPKLRGQFAEFLNRGYPERLRILSSPTCVGLRYGQLPISLRSFSWQCGISEFTYPKIGSPSPLGVGWDTIQDSGFA